MDDSFNDSFGEGDELVVIAAARRQAAEASDRPADPLLGTFSTASPSIGASAPAANRGVEGGRTAGKVLRDPFSSFADATDLLAAPAAATAAATGGASTTDAARDLQYDAGGYVKPLTHVGKAEGLVKRPQVWVKDFDLRGASKVTGINKMKTMTTISLEALIAILTLFNAVSTLMILATTFEAAVPATERTAFQSESLFNVLAAILIYSPLCFFAVVIMIVNNSFAEAAYYTCLKRGIVLDYPMSAQPKQIFSSAQGVAFTGFFVAYCVVALTTFIMYAASVGLVIIFITNLGIGCLLTWYRQQTVEDRFVSLSEFVQLFPDRDGEFGNIDEHSLHWAAEFLRRVTLVEAQKPSYFGTARRLLWKLQKVNATSQVRHHALVAATIAVLIGMCLAYFLVQRDLEAEKRWSEHITPCAEACIDASSRAARSWGVSINVSAFTSQSVCHDCVCRCIDRLGFSAESELSNCEVPPRPFCGPAVCPSRCV